MKLACAVLVAGAALAQAPADPHRAVVEGRVVNSLTGEAIRKADLSLTTDIMPDDFDGVAAQFGLGNDAKPKPSQPKNTFVATSDASGKFQFKSVAPGDYFFTIKHAGFVYLTYKATGENRSADGLLHVKGGQEISDLEVRLVPEGAAVGKVVDEDGDPAVNVTVTASAVTYASGHPRLQLRDSGTTNDRGEYRLGKLPPGRYYIAAELMQMEMAPPPPPPPPPPDGAPETGYVRTYYPKATALADAEPVDVKAGVDSPGISIQLQKSRVVRVKGIAVGTDGKPLKGAQIMLMAAGRPFSMRMIMANNPEGKFELANVPPGAYNVMIMQLADQKMVQQPLFVPAENLSGVKLGVVPEGTVQGRVNFVGDAKIALKGLSVTLEADEDSLIIPVSTTTDATGAFVLKKVVAASYQFDLSPMPQGVYLKSVRWNGTEKLGEQFDFGLGSAAGLEVLLGTDGGAFDAKVLRDDRPVADATVVLLPADTSLRNRVTVLSGEADGSGHVAFEGVPPGDYLAIAWEKIEEGDWFDPAVVKAAESSALKVTIGPKENQHADLKVVPPR